MTDDFPKDEQETMIPEDSFAVGDEENSAESWKEPPSSEDGFSDAELLQEDFQDSGEMQEEQIEEIPAENPFQGNAVDKGRGKVVLVGLAGVGVLLLGGLAYFQFGQTEDYSGSSPLAPLVNMVEVNTAQPQEKNAAPDQEGITPTTAETDMALLYQSSKQHSAAYSQAVALPKDKEETVADGSKEELVKSTEVIVNDSGSEMMPSAPLPNEQKAPQIAKIENIAVKPAVPQMKETPSPVTADALSALPEASISVEAESKLQEMSEKISQLEAELAKANQAKEELAARLDSSQKPQETTAQNELEEKLAKTEARLSARDKELEVAKENLAKTRTQNEELLAQLKTREEQSIVLDEPVKVQKTAVVQKTKKKAKAKKEKRVTKVKKEDQILTFSAPAPDALVLRAATPDAAWVASSKSSLDLKRVAMGDVLPKIGKIILIRQKDGKWEVVGTNGVLR